MAFGVAFTESKNMICTQTLCFRCCPRRGARSSEKHETHPLIEQLGGGDGDGTTEEGYAAYPRSEG